MRGTLLSLLAIALFATSVEARVRMASIWADDMVIQRDQDVMFWGESDARDGQVVSITPSWSNKLYRTTVAAGKWSIEIPTASAGGPYTVSFNDGDVVTLKNVMMGDVWLCMGQSNMQMTMMGGGASNQPIEGAQRAIVEAQASDNIRMYQMEVTPSQSPQKYVEGRWSTCTSKAVSEFSAVGYFFGRDLYDKLDVPIALLSINKGASNIETWMCPEWLEQVKAYDYSVLYAEKIPYRYQQEVCLLYNGMLAPLEGLAVKGAIWYQGESNIYNAAEYERLFPIFVKGLREHFDGGEFPFYYAQIAPYNAVAGYDNGVAMRELQCRLQDITPRTGMVALTDIGEERIIHPRKKAEVGQRLALWALSDAYGVEGLECRAPEYQEMMVTTIAEGSETKGIALKFSNSTPLYFKDSTPSTQFEIAGEDRVFHPARVKFATIKGGYTMVVWSDDVESPVAVRYAFHNYAEGDLMTNFGLAVSSFRTDDWELNIKESR